MFLKKTAVVILSLFTVSVIVIPSLISEAEAAGSTLAQKAAKKGGQKAAKSGTKKRELWIRNEIKNLLKWDYSTN